MGLYIFAGFVLFQLLRRKNDDIIIIPFLWSSYTHAGSMCIINYVHVGPIRCVCGSITNNYFCVQFLSVRCYNCGDFGNHIAAKCPHGPLPKRCHYCKAEDHLIADCPLRDQNSKSQRDSDSGGETPGPGSNGFGGGDGGASSQNGNGAIASSSTVAS